MEGAKWKNLKNNWRRDKKKEGKKEKFKTEYWPCQGIFGQHSARNDYLSYRGVK